MTDHNDAYKAAENEYQQIGWIYQDAQALFVRVVNPDTKEADGSLVDQQTEKETQ